VTRTRAVAVRVWDLATGAPIGDPVTGHTDAVTAVATLLLPENQPIAVTGSIDATVRVCDLATGGSTHVLPFPWEIMGVATVVVGGRPSVVAVGDGIAAFRL
jgi:WD40 repeat protein